MRVGWGVTSFDGSCSPPACSYHIRRVSTGHRVAVSYHIRCVSTGQRSSLVAAYGASVPGTA
eukprot:260282-Rhodomonas_salina.2